MKKSTTIGIAAALTVRAVWAFDYGKWYCRECSFGAAGTPQTAFDQSTVLTFLLARNFQIMQSGPLKDRTHAWILGDTIQICNGEGCYWIQYFQPYKWRAMGPVYPDDGEGYKNSKEETPGAGIEPNVPRTGYEPGWAGSMTARSLSGWYSVTPGPLVVYGSGISAGVSHFAEMLSVNY